MASVLAASLSRLLHVTALQGIPSGFVRYANAPQIRRAVVES